MKKSKTFRIVFLYVFIFVMCMGASFAWYVWQGSSVAVNVNFSGLDPYLNYDATSVDTSSQTITPSSDYSGGVHNDITFKKKEEGNNLNVYGHVYVKVSSVDSDIFKSSAVKWTLVSKTGNTETEISTGNFVGEAVNNEIPANINFPVVNSNVNTTYRVYVWIDSDVSQNVNISNKNINVTTYASATTENTINENYIREIDYDASNITKLILYSSKYNINGYKITNTNTQPSSWDNVTGSAATKEAGYLATVTSNINISSYSTIYVWMKNTNGDIAVKSFSKGTSSSIITLSGNGATKNSNPTELTATYDSSTLSPATITLPQRNYTVTYNANGTGATMPSNGTVTYPFSGWYTDATNGSLLLSNSTTPVLQSNVSGYTDSNGKWNRFDSVTAYAHWGNASTITLGTISKTGYTCSWNTEDDGSGTSYTSGQTGYTTNENKTLFADCDANTYNISYTLNGGTHSTSCATGANPTSANYDTDVRICNPTRSGYTFSGWTSSNVGSNAKSGTSATPSTAWTGSSTKNTYFRNLRDTSGTVTMVANWSENTLSGGSVAISGTNTWGQTLTATITDTSPTATYTCAWYHTSIASGNKITDASVSSNKCTYTIDKSYVEKTIYVQITATKTNYTTKTFNDATDATNNTTATVAKQNLSVTATPYSAAYDGSTHYATIKVTSADWDGSTIVSGTSTSYGETVTSSGVVNTNYNLSPGYKDFTNGAKNIYYKVTGGIYYNDKTGSTTVNITKGTCTAPANITIGTDKKVSWTASASASSYEISMSSSSGFVAHTSGSVYNDITNSTGTRTVYVRSVCDSTNYNTPSDAVSKSTTVYSVSLTKGTGIASVTGAGNYITGAVVSINATVSDGYTWSKWTRTSGGTQVSTERAYSATISGDWSYTANATPNPYNITYKDCGDTAFSGIHGNNYPQTYTYGVGATLDSPTKEGNTFAGYYSTSTCTGAAVTSIGTSETGNKTFYAKWADNPPYDLAITSTNNVATSQTATLTCKDTTGVTGYYWGTTAPTASSTFTSITSTTSMSQTKTVSAAGTYYLACKDESGNITGVSTTVSKTFYKTTLSMTNGSVSPTSVITMSGNKFALPTPTASTGHTVVGNWYTNSGMTTGAKAYGADYTPSATATLYSSATANSYNITYKDCGDTTFSGAHGNNYPQTYTYGVGATLDTPTKTGYTFAGYFAASACTGTAVTSIGTSETGNKTFYAKWNTNVAKVTINKDGSKWTTSNPGINVALYQSGTSKYAYSAGTKSSDKSEVTWSTVTAGTYDIYISKDTNHLTDLIDSGVDLTVTSDADKTVNLYTLTMSLSNTTVTVNGTSVANGNTVVVAGTTYLHSIAATAATGYTFSSWSSSSASTTITNTESASTTLKAGAASTITATSSANELTFEGKTITKTFSTSSQTENNAINEATGGSGSYTYAIIGGNSNNYFSLTDRNLTIAANTPANTTGYSITVRATDSNTGSNKDATYIIIINKATCAAPTGVTIGADKKVSWTASASASSYEISMSSSSGFVAHTSGSVYDAITDETGSRTVYVRSVCNSTNYNTPSANASASTTVYSVSLTKGTGIASVSGAGNYVTGATVTLGATASTGYTWNNWTQTTGGDEVSTTNAYSAAINSNWDYTANATANTYTITYNNNGGAGCTTHEVTYNSIYGTVCTPTRDNYTFAGWATEDEILSPENASSAGKLLINSGGTVTASVSGYTDANKKWIKASDTDLYAIWANYEILNGSTHVSYIDGLSNAISASSAGYTIKALHNNESGAVTIDKNLTLNTNSKTITMTGIMTIDASKTVTINGSGTITRTDATKTIANNGTLTITSATVNNSTGYTIFHYATSITNVNSGASITGKYGVFSQKGTLNINGGTISTTSYAIARPENSDGAVTIDISSGSVTASSATAIRVDSTSNATTLKVRGGSVTGLYGIVVGTTASSSTSIEVQNATVTGANLAISLPVGTLAVKTGAVINSTDTDSDALYCYGTCSSTITGGTIEGARLGVSIAGSASATISSGTVIGNSSNAVYNAGGTVTISGGTFTDGNGTMIANTSGTTNINGGTKSVAASKVASISGGTVNYANSGTPSYTTNGGDGLSISAGTLNFKGGSISASSGRGIYITGGTVNVSGGSITTTTNNYPINNAGGTLNISSTPSITAGASSVVATDSGTTNITGGTFASSSSCSSGCFGARSGGGIVNIDGGTYSSPLYVGLGAGGTINFGQNATPNISAEKGIWVNSGTINFKKGTLTTSASQGIVSSESTTSATITISGGKIDSSTNAIALQFRGATTFTISAGTITGMNALATGNTASGTISGGTLTGSTASCISHASSGTLDITGGSITGADTSTAVGVWNHGGGRVNVGSDNGTVSTSSPTIYAHQASSISSSDGTWYFYDGSLYGASIPTYNSYAPTGTASGYYPITVVDSTWGYRTYLSNDPYYRVSNSSGTILGYTRALTSAVSMTPASGTITALKANSSGAVTISKNLTINPNGKTITMTGVMTTQANVTLTGSGTITTSTVAQFIQHKSGTLTVSGPTISNTYSTGTAIRAFAGTVKVTSGTIQAPYFGIASGSGSTYCDGNTTFNISGGTIKATHTSNVSIEAVMAGNCTSYTTTLSISGNSNLIGGYGHALGCAAKCTATINGNTTNYPKLESTNVSTVMLSGNLTCGSTAGTGDDRTAWIVTNGSECAVNVTSAGTLNHYKGCYTGATGTTTVYISGTANIGGGRVYGANSSQRIKAETGATRNQIGSWTTATNSTTFTFTTVTGYKPYGYSYRRS